MRFERILRDGVQFLGVGVIQLVLDVALYVVLTQAGVGLAVANLGGRAASSVCGYWLNGRVTFLHRVQPRVHIRIARYVVLWLALSVISTAALAAVADVGGLSSTWWAKPLIEAVLGIVSFLLSRHWVYQR